MTDVMDVGSPALVTPQRPPRLVRHRETTALLGMSVFVASWAMLFAALFFAYGITRVRAVAWPPPDQPGLPLALPAVGLLLLVVASGALHAGLLRARALAWRWAVIGAIAASAGFLAIQLHVWQALAAAGLRSDGGPYASVVYGLTGFHAVHVAVGIVGLATVLPNLVRGLPRPPLSLRLWSVYVHMCGVLFALMFVGVYCL